jgi:hypothetical protein
MCDEEGEMGTAAAINPAQLDAVKTELRDRARTRSKPEATITYGDLAERMGMPPFRNANWLEHPLSDILGQLNDEDHALGRPFLSCLVVNGQTHYSGPSFFKAVAGLRRNGNPIPKAEQYTFWSAEMGRLLEFYKRVP